MIDQAVLAMRAALDELVREMQKKGHQKATAEATVLSSGAVRIMLDTNGAEAFQHVFSPYRWFIESSPTFAEAYQRATKAVADDLQIDPEISCAAWFEMAQMETAPQ